MATCADGKRARQPLTGDGTAATGDGADTGATGATGDGCETWLALPDPNAVVKYIPVDYAADVPNPLPGAPFPRFGSTVSSRSLPAHAWTNCRAMPSSGR